MTDTEIQSLTDRELITAYEAAVAERDPIVVDKLAAELERRELEFGPHR